MTRKHVAILALILALLALGAWLARPRPAALVNGEAITRADLDRELELRFGAEVLQEMVSERLIAQALRTYGLDVPPREVDLWVADYRARPEAQAMMAAGRLSEARLRRNLATAVPLFHLALRDVPEEERKQFFRDHRADFEELRLRHILLGSADEAAGLRERIRQPSDFATLATIHSLDPRTGKSGGDLGPTSRAELQGSFARADVDRLFGLKPGEISSPMQAGGGGWHLFMVEGRRVDYESLKRRVVEAMAQDRIEPLRQRLQASGKVEILLDLEGQAAEAPPARPPRPGTGAGASPSTRPPSPLPEATGAGAVRPPSPGAAGAQP